MINDQWPAECCCHWCRHTEIPAKAVWETTQHMGVRTVRAGPGSVGWCGVPHTDTEKRAFPLIGNETSRSIIRNAHSRQYFSRQQMAMRWVAPRLTVGSYTAEKTKNTCGPSERSEFKKNCRTVKSWVESALKLIDILQDCKHKSCSCEWFTHP